ncbi:MAG TPA: ABC transporter permease [Bryobacteraceae bacterium]|nr:ABC transporter permease [Bryobacteraceae bacterium]
MHDLRFALRKLRKNPAFALVAILSLALGTGANTAIFSLIDAVMLRMLPVSHPEQLVFVNTNAVQMGSVRVSESIRVASLDYIAQHATNLSGIAASQLDGKIGIGVDGQTDRAAASFVSPAYYSVLGVNPLMGRTLTADDAQPGGRVAVLSYAYWQRRMGGSPTVLGRQITVNSVPFVIVGVTPREFYGVSADDSSDITVPFATLPQVTAGKISSESPKLDDATGLVFARLKNGVTLQQAAAELTPLLRQSLLQSGGETPARFQAVSKLRVDLTPGSQGLSHVRNRFSEPLKVLMAVVAIVLLIACANIANLLLAKSSARQREIAIRMSLGSSRWRLVRQLLTESLLLAIGGGALGLLFAVWARDAIVRAAAVPDIPFTWDLRVIGFTAGVCLLNALLFGTMPALRATSFDFATALKSSRTGRTAGRLTLGRVLVAAQVALSLALLVGAGLFLGTFRNLDRVDLGYARKDALLIAVDPHLAGYRGVRIAEFYKQALDRVATAPGVRSVSLMRDRLMSGNITMSGVFVPGYTPKNGEDPQHIWVISNSVGSGFFQTAGMQFLNGRDFTDQDNEHGTKVAVVNETMARHFFDTPNAVGRQVSEGPGEPAIEIVGVVRDLKYFGVREGKQDVMFTPAGQYADAPNHATLLIRTTAEPSIVVSTVRAAIRAIDPALPVYDVITVDQQVEKTLVLQRLLAILSVFFGALALTLAAIGLYGVLSYGIAQRTGEIGIRMALGARPAMVLRMILGETARVVLAGVLVGIALALSGARLVRSMLFGVTPADATSLTAAAVLLLAAALVAAFLPARRASHVDPMVALRHE